MLERALLALVAVHNVSLPLLRRAAAEGEPPIRVVEISEPGAGDAEAA